MKTPFNSHRKNTIKYAKKNQADWIRYLATELEKSDKQKLEILKYCANNTQYMWSASIVSILLGCDFKDAKKEVKNYLLRELEMPEEKYIFADITYESIAIESERK